MKEIYIFDSKSGVTTKHDSRSRATIEIGIDHKSQITRSIQDGCLIQYRYKASVGRLSRKEKTVLYEEYWRRNKELLEYEVWKVAPMGLLISNLGRIKTPEGVIKFPTMSNNNTIIVYYNNKVHNILRAMAELYVINRRLTDDEVVCRRVGLREFSYDMLYILTWDQYRERGQKARRKELALLDEEGNVLKIYPSVKSAAEENFINREGLFKALKDKRKCCGLKFDYMDNLY